jgi:hypothetical protein
LFREFLGVGESLDRVVGVENHGGGHDRTRERSAPNLVDATEQ